MQAFRCGIIVMPRRRFMLLAGCRQQVHAVGPLRIFQRIFVVELAITIL